jgi:hypothetical protein
MPRVTPTGLAEATYQAARSKPMPKGPAGIAIPHQRALYRLTLDDQLARAMAKAAGAARRAALLPAGDRAEVAQLLLAALHHRYPQAEMATLQKWEFAWPHRSVTVELPGWQTHHMELPEPCIIPRGSPTAFGADPTRPTSGMRLPTGATVYFRTLAEIEQLTTATANGVHGWAVRFRKDHERVPRWGEIEAAWPLIGEWLADQRRQIEGAMK